MTSPSRDEIPESEIDQEKLARAKKKLSRKQEKLSNDKERLEETRIDDRQSQSQMQNKILESNGLKSFLTGQNLEKDLGKWTEWLKELNSQKPNPDGSFTRIPLPEDNILEDELDDA